MNSNELKSIVFTGKGFEYFKLCIANLFLSVITLGIYSAWATVRNTQYLYGHTSADNHAFQYHAKPIQILIGRLIAFALLIAYLFLSSISPALNLVLLLVIMIFAPFIIVRSIKFRMQMTSYRNIRFNFTGKVGDAFLVFLLYPFLSVFTLYLAFPLVLKKQKEYFFNNVHYGPKAFKAELETGVFYKIFAICFAIYAGFLLIFGAIFFQQFLSGEIYITGGLGLLYIPVILVSVISAAVYRAMLWKHIAQNVEVSDVATFDTNITVSGLTKLYVTNILLFIFTFGIAGPWVVIRTQRYLCEHTQYATTPEIEVLVAEKNKESSALGDEAAGAFDIDAGGSFI